MCGVAHNPRCEHSGQWDKERVVVFPVMIGSVTTCSGCLLQVEGHGRKLAVANHLQVEGHLVAGIRCKSHCGGRKTSLQKSALQPRSVGSYRAVSECCRNAASSLRPTVLACAKLAACWCQAVLIYEGFALPGAILRLNLACRGPIS